MQLQHRGLGCMHICMGPLIVDIHPGPFGDRPGRSATLADHPGSFWIDPNVKIRRTAQSADDPGPFFGLSIENLKEIIQDRELFLKFFF